ncbi:22513_t:CDS:2 [Gigaspora margarita]|uniref:22513_t:CDS:1 n=1 Tax=Gigaspora margarita TaxID=4874 RepID=A0ABN7W8M3_GIGMA|nr:22513_t:CDS:2 [Gigaspora margarita]
MASIKTQSSLYKKDNSCEISLTCSVTCQKSLVCDKFYKEPLSYIEDNYQHHLYQVQVLLELRFGNSSRASSLSNTNFSEIDSFIFCNSLRTSISSNNSNRLKTQNEELKAQDKELKLQDKELKAQDKKLKMQTKH